VIICSAGFTSEDYDKGEIYKNLVESFPNTEVFAVNWASSTEKNVATTVASKAVGFLSKLNSSGLSLSTNPINLIKTAYNSYQTYQELKQGIWNGAFEESIVVGTYLAHLIADTQIFRNHSISLVGFSLGTMVIVTCIWELEKLDRQDLIYDVLLMGGVVNIVDFNRESLSVIGNKLVNAYSKKDMILKTILRAVDLDIDPIGMFPIISDDKKVINLDVTQQVGGHLDYSKKMNEVFNRVDFNQDLGFMLRRE